MSAARVFALIVWLLPALVGTLTTFGSTGCIWLDDFDKFSISDAGPEFRDTSVEDPEAGAERCRNVDCSSMDAPCIEGRCNPSTGTCIPFKLPNGDSCFDSNPCSQHDACTDGKCMGEAVDCSQFDDECSQGMCDPASGGCTFGPNQMSRPCDDANPCTTGDRCDNDGLCVKAADADKGATCTDFNACTGTGSAPDSCDGKGHCVEGADVAQGARCDDDSECTQADRCDGMGGCIGDAAREGQACQGDCTSNTVCLAGVCRPRADDTAPAYDPSCVFNLCGQASICRPEWETDHRVCHCGCGFSDPDCGYCSARMCQTDNSLDHIGVRWCDAEGQRAGNCPDSLKADGHCDCGCQFEDPDCSGGSCCAGTGKPGCDNAFVENCVCRHETNADPSCCEGEWTPRCAELAVGLGCATCPTE